MSRIREAYRRFMAFETPAAPTATPAPGRAAVEAAPVERAATRPRPPAVTVAEPAPEAPAPQLPHPSALGGIALLHVEHEARARRVKALHRARVAVLGTPPGSDAELARILRRCGGGLVSSDDVRPTLWLAGDDVAPERIAALRRIGCLVVDADELTALADEYRQTMAGSWLREAVSAAIYRLRLVQRAMLLVREQPRRPADLPRRPAAPLEDGPRPAPSARRVPRQRNAPRRVPPRSGRPSAADELAASIEAAARARRSANPRCRLYDPPAA